MSSTTVYTPDAVTASIAGINIEGAADGEWLSLKMVSDQYSDVIGTQGDVARSRSNDYRADVEVTLLQTSPTNDLLSALAEADRNSLNGAGVGSFQIKDNSGRSLYYAAEAWIMKLPDVSFDRTVKERKWTIRCARLVPYTGGNF
jgi:hypothetical protein